jgi:hypothetical protein
LKKVYDLYLEEISYPKGTCVKVTKLDTLNTEHKLFGHPNGVENGGTYFGTLLTTVTVHTSNVTEITDKNHFKTKNSLYEITKYE